MPITPQIDTIFGSGSGVFGRLGSNPVSTVLSDGRIAVAWNEWEYPGDGSIPGIDYQVWTSILNPDGTISVPASIVNDTNVGSHGAPQIAALSDGGYVVNWIVMNHETVQGDGQTVYTYESMVRSFTATGTAEGAAAEVSPDLAVYDPSDYNSMLSNNITRSNIISLDGGGALTLYSYRESGAIYDDAGTWARVVGNDGQTLGTPVRIWESSNSTMEAVQLTSGDLVFLNYEGDLVGYSIRITGADLTSAPTSVPGATGPVEFLHDPEPFLNATGYISGVRLAALSDGSFTVIYGYNHQLGADNDESLRLDRYDAAGQYQSTVVIPVLDDVVQQPGAVPYEILGLSGGRIMVVWSHAVAYGDLDIMGVIVNADGTLESVPAVINPNTTGLQLLGDLSLLPNGDVFMTVTDASGALVGGVADYMHGVVLDVPGVVAPIGVNYVGTSGHDTFYGGAADDTAHGYAGNDTLGGGGGNDSLFGEAGNDMLMGNAGRDYLDGGAGYDQLWAGADNDTLMGGNGADVLGADLGNDLIYGDDTVESALDGNDSIYAGAGNDTAYGMGGNDEIWLGDGLNLAYGGSGDDVLGGGADADSLHGGDGQDSLYAGAGDDSIWGDAGNDIIWTGTGSDWADGGAGNDLLGGVDGDDTLLGGLGDDTLYGGAGDDSLEGGDGNDEIWGGTGANTLHGGAGNDLLGGGALNDVIHGGSGHDTIYAAAGDDYITGDYGNDEIWAGAGNDTLDGGDDQDTLAGLDGNDSITGGRGDDLLMGAAGADTLVGDAGNDTIWGGADADLFVFTAGDGQDMIGDFNGVAGDRLNLSDSLWAGAGPLDATGVVAAYASNGATGIELSFTGGETITLTGFWDMANLDSYITIV
ncbi:Ca2+-binding protein, RTX toxin-related [Thalassovita litoralis]|uniref:Ca2+-binding protein, RTX toxin-related n=1 Tax=Thalassovita litoralis TaxID=1010611 RepID=A0A521B104_9RHOB|nr:calcium-binding protein [Thalassovita litoralis]SMO40715.1 Ca2+-binding protein, RTX toxin-related [Thalassovita litoralis]